MPEREESYIKVAMVSGYPLLSERPDGVTRFILEGKPHFERKGLKIRTVAPHTDDPDNVADYTLGRTVTLKHIGTQHQSGFSLNRMRARNILLTVKPDIISFQAPEGSPPSVYIMISALPKRSDGKYLSCVIPTFHAQAEQRGLLNQSFLILSKYMPGFTLWKGIFPGITRPMFQVVRAAYAGRIAVSQASLDFWNKIDRAEYEIIPNGIETDELTPEGETIPEWKEDGKKVIFFAGRHDDRKGFEVGIEAYKILRKTRTDIKLKIAGEGPKTGELLSQVYREHLPEVEFTGVLPRDQLVKAYRTVKKTRGVFVSPAKGRESFGRVLAEALSCGTLVVGSDINGYREVIGQQPFARMGRPEDPEDLARAIVELLDLPKEEEVRLSYMARDYVVRNYSWDIVAGKTVAYYEKCLNEHGRADPTEWPRKRKRKPSIPRSAVVFEDGN